MSQAGTPRKPSLNKDLDVAKKITVYQNGNKHFGGCDTYLNPKHYPNPNIFMDYLTTLIPKKGGRNKGCIRKLYTKSGRRIYGFGQISHGGEIVAAGDEDFKKDSYQSIQAYRTPRKGQRQSRNNNFAQNKNSKYEDIKPRFHETGEPGIRIYIHKNDQPFDKSVLVLLRQKRLGQMHYVMEDINTELYEDSKFPVGFVCDLNGVPVTKTTDFQPEEFYVAVPPNQSFKPAPYSCRRHDLPNFITNPYYGTGFPRSTYLWQDLHSSRPTTWTSKHNPIPPISKPSPNQSVASHPETNLRRRKIQNTHEDVHQKPVKHKRTPETKVRQVDYDQDNSSVFRAKKENKTTKGAKEVRETKDTKTDLPIDQVKAEEVEEDYGYDKEDRRSPRGAGYTKEKSDRDLNPYKVLEPIKKDDRSSTPVHDDDDDDDEKRKEDEAATKIQASFRGHQARQEVAQIKKDQDTSQNKDTSQRKDTPQSKDTPQRKDTPQKEKTKDNLASDAENEAAAKIQAGFRGYQTRQELKAKGHKVRPPISSQGDTGDVSKVAKVEEDAAATKIQASVRGYQARKEIKTLKEEKKKNEAATLIQANYKGFKVRKEIKENKPGEAGKTTKETPKNETDNKELTEDEAATKIQASFRGYQTREKIKDDREQGEGINQGNGSTVISTPPHSSEAPGTNRHA
ncbi:doublecortin domain-containing protein 2-like isoform X4 [Mizuhopecten yessoensis]|uniref:doublecortin domain-containing protein 2-like isoform X4 n=1 Tax=Mizuhopecten yessoensis TaxID=6573 RepID=UPI000B4582BD|nr:doublecortin domain-containing protein 2-like isoform X4 [Mizuhopecten yessoensis]